MWSGDRKRGFIYFEASDWDVYDVANRMNRLDQLGGWYGVKRLCEFYRELSDQLGEPIEVDIIGWCSAWVYYESLDDAVQDGHDLSLLEEEGLHVLEVKNADGDVIGYFVPICEV